MSERCHISFVTFQITMVFLFLHETCVHAAFISDYDTLFQKLLPESDELTGNRPKRLEYRDEYGQEKREMGNSLILKLSEALMPEPIDRLNVLSPDVESKRFLSEIVDNTSKREFVGTHVAQPAMSKLLTIIDKFNLPRYKTVTENVLKRNDRNNNSVFGSLIQAAYRLGELEVDKPKNPGRHFHAWGG